MSCRLYVLALAAVTVVWADATEWSRHMDSARLALSANDAPTAEKELAVALTIAKGLPKTDPALGLTLNDLGALAMKSGKAKRAATRFGEALEAFRRAHGPVHARVAEALYNLGTARLQLGDLDEAYDLLRESIRMQPKVFAEDDVRRAHPFQSLAILAVSRERFNSARGNFRIALSRIRSAAGPDSAVFKSAVEQTSAAYDRMIADILRAAGRSDPRAVLLRQHKSSVLATYGEPEAAVTAAEEAVDAATVLDGARSPLLIRPLIDLGQSQRRAQDFARAAAAFERAIELTNASCPDYPRTQLVPLGQLSRIQAESGEGAAALATAQSLVALARRAYGENHGRHRRYIELSAETLRSNGHHQQAATIAGLMPPETPSVDRIHLTGLEKRVRRTKAVQPNYPEEARKFGLENSVNFRATVGADGKVVDVHPEVCVGFGFEKETVKAVSRSRYEPATLGGTPVASSVSGSVNFTINTRRR